MADNPAEFPELPSKQARRRVVTAERPAKPGYWLTGYQRGWLGHDAVAGLTVTAILIPEGMAYAQLAGVDPKAAFYAAPVALLLYAFLGSSRQLVVAVSSAVAITSAATISELAAQGTAEYVALTAALALFAGLISMVAGVLRLGRIARLFSTSVLLGFVFGLALVITVKQVTKLLGVELTETEFFKQVWQIIQKLSDVSVVTLIVGMACLVGMALLQRFMPKLPAALAVLAVSIVISALLHLSDHGVAVVGPLPSGLARPRLPSVGWDSVSLLFAGALGIALLAFAEAMGPAQQLAKEHGYEVDANRELVAIGAANAGAGLFQGFPIGASLSKSAANDRAGARSPMSLVVAAAATALIALFLTPLFRDLPEATLGAIVIVAVSDMERVGPLKRLWRIRRADCVLALVALFGVLILGILPGLGFAVALSLAVIVWRAGEGRLQFVGQHPSGSRDVADPSATITGMLVARPLQMVFFVNAAEIREAVTDAVARADRKPDVVLVDLGLTPDLDVPALDTLTELRERLEATGSRLWIATEIDLVLDRLQRAEVCGPECVFQDVTVALVAYVSRHTSGGEQAREILLKDLLTFIEVRGRHASLDERGRATLHVLEAQIRQLLSPSEARDERRKVEGSTNPVEQASGVGIPAGAGT